VPLLQHALRAGAEDHSLRAGVLVLRCPSDRRSPRVHRSRLGPPHRRAREGVAVIDRSRRERERRFRGHRQLQGHPRPLARHRRQPDVRLRPRRRNGGVGSDHPAGRRVHRRGDRHRAGVRHRRRHRAAHQRAPGADGGPAVRGPEAARRELRHRAPLLRDRRRRGHVLPARAGPADHRRSTGGPQRSGRHRCPGTRRAVPRWPPAHELDDRRGRHRHGQDPRGAALPPRRRCSAASRGSSSRWRRPRPRSAPSRRATA